MSIYRTALWEEGRRSDETAKPRALIAMSGGVDSSVAALEMIRRGYHCTGVTMKLYDNDDPDISSRVCCSIDDVEDARQVCYSLGMPHYVMNFKEEFSCMVMDRFVQAYECGDTPNPCIDCNRYLKFARLYDRAIQLECEVLVTGHYARIDYDPLKKRYLLKKSRNLLKDQSYVLAFLTQDILAHTCFPLGEFRDKEEVRLLAAAHGFGNAEKHDSQDICFIPDGDYASFIKRRTGKEYPEGDFVDEEGHVLGRHKGLIRYTIGQRRGLGLALPAPLYVRKKDMEKNQVILSPDSGLYQKELYARDFNWISCEAPKAPIKVTAKPRYRAPEAEAVADVLPDGIVRVVFEQPQRAITPGQTVVLYDGETVVGGGIIISSS